MITDALISFSAEPRSFPFQSLHALNVKNKRRLDECRMVLSVLFKVSVEKIIIKKAIKSFYLISAYILFERSCL